MEELCQESQAVNNKYAVIFPYLARLSSLFVVQTYLIFDSFVRLNWQISKTLFNRLQNEIVFPHEFLFFYEWGNTFSSG